MSKEEYFSKFIKASAYYDSLGFEQVTKLVLDFKSQFPNEQASVMNIVAFIACDLLEGVA